jgi:putative copper resistance protein D
VSELTAALRFFHFSAAIALAGEFAFLLLVARPDALLARSRRAATLALAVLLASGVLWYFVQVAVMSGGEAFDATALSTLFGRVAIARLLLALALGAALLALRRSPRKTPLFILCGALAAALLATLAATGHGAAEQGRERTMHLAADALHLLAAGAWLGALPWLAFVLRKGADAALAARAVRRFSVLGIASVATLIVTGTANAWYTVGDFPSLFGTAYGELLCVKLVLFAAMLALAAANRLRWTPQLGALPVALSRLRRNATAEIALGLAVLALVAALGVTVPALHAKIFWPFSHTLEWSALARPRETVPAALFFAVLALAIVAFGAIRRRPWTAAGGAALLALTALVFAAPLVVPAHPTTYFESPATYNVASVMRGAPLYAQHCQSCHGPYGNGDGPLADSLPKRLPYLPTRLETRREGDLLWALARGVPGTAMPGFGQFLGEDQLWDLLTFIRAQANVDAGRRLDASVQRWRPVTPPNFTFQTGRGEQESLEAQRGRYTVLLVFYSLPQSLPRLRELAEAKTSRLARMGLRIVAVPVDGALPRDTKGLDSGMLAGPDAALVAAYAMFTRTIVSPPSSRPRHAEFLIDRQGTIRARTIQSGSDPGWGTPGELLRQVVILNKERPRADAPRRHAH